MNNKINNDDIEDIEKTIEEIKNKIITIDNINRINDCYIRYLFSDLGNENIVLNFINSVMKNRNMPTFSKVEILNPFNLGKYINAKESVVDIKCIISEGDIVIIEIQLQGNESFIQRILFYWARSYSVLLNKSSNYDRLPSVISINILNFILFDDIEDVHTCYLLKEMDHNKILTMDCQFHFLELPKFNLMNDDKYSSKDFSGWLRFLKGEKMSVLSKENTIFEEIKLKSESFIHDEPLLDTYRQKEIDDFFNKEMLNKEVSKAESRGWEAGMREGKEAGIREGKEVGIREGKEVGIREGKEVGMKEQQILIAKKLKSSGLDNKFISETTGLSLEEIEKL